MSTVLLRPIEGRDSEAIRAIYNWAVANTTATMDTAFRLPEKQAAWMDAHDGNPYPALVAESWDEPGRVVGYAALSPYNPRDGYRTTAEVSIYVHPDWHNLGIGGTLLHGLIVEAKRRGFVSLVSLVTADNEASLRLHARPGFVAIGTLTRVARKFDRWVDVTILQLHLDKDTV